MKRFASLAVIVVIGVSSAQAASLFVRPTTIVMAQGTSAAGVTVTNNGTAPLTAQLRVFSWDQSENEDKLNPTTSIAASPPMMTIAPGQSQTIRLVRVAAAPAVQQENYRLLVDEIADRNAADANSGVLIQLRYSVPVFVMPKARDAAKLSMSAQVADHSLVFDAVNRGKAHAQISNIALVYADGTSQLVGSGLVGYVLPDRNRRWTLPVPEGTTAPRQVKALVNGKEVQLKL